MYIISTSNIIDSNTIMSKQQKKMKDVTVEEIENMLREKQLDIRGMDQMTKSSREKLKKINKKMDTQEKKLIEIVTKLTTNEAMIGALDNYNEGNINFSKEIETVTNNLRNIRSSLADIIRKQ
jgi:hypothetical protein